MFNDYKVLYFPTDGSGASSSGDTGAGDVEPESSGVTDKDILNQGDEDGDEEVSDDESEETDEGEEGETEDSGDQESDGSGDEDSEDEEDIEDSEASEDAGVLDEGIDASDLAKSVKKIAPNLFKKVPGLREALTREKEYGEVFTTPEQAKIAAQNTEYMQAMYSDIASGDVEKTGNFLKAIKNTNEEAFEDFSHTVLESIGKLNPQLYGEVMLKPMKKAIMAMYADALRTGNKNLAAVAIHAHNYWFDTQDIKAPLEDRKPNKRTKEQTDLERDKQEFENTKHQDFRGAITEVVNHSMKLSITKELDGIKLDDYQKRNIIRDIFTGVDEVLGSDKRYLGGINSLFDQARSSRYSPDWKSRIVKAYLQRARQALPAIRNKVLREAGIRFKESPKSESRRLVPAGLGGNKSEGRIDFSRVDRTKTTDMDILNGKPKYLK